MTCADAELAVRGRGPPPVPRRMSLVAVLCAAAVLGFANTPAIAAVFVKNARRESVCIPKVAGDSRSSAVPLRTLGFEPTLGVAPPQRRRRWQGRRSAGSASEFIKV